MFEAIGYEIRVEQLHKHDIRRLDRARTVGAAITGGANTTSVSDVADSLLQMHVTIRRAYLHRAARSGEAFRTDAFFAFTDVGTLAGVDITAHYSVHGFEALTMSTLLVMDCQMTGSSFSYPWTFIFTAKHRQ